MNAHHMEQRLSSCKVKENIIGEAPTQRREKRRVARSQGQRAKITRTMSGRGADHPRPNTMGPMWLPGLSPEEEQTVQQQAIGDLTSLSDKVNRRLQDGVTDLFTGGRKHIELLNINDPSEDTEERISKQK